MVWGGGMVSVSRKCVKMAILKTLIACICAKKLNLVLVIVGVLGGVMGRYLAWWVDIGRLQLCGVLN